MFSFINVQIIQIEINVFMTKWRKTLPNSMTNFFKSIATFELEPCFAVQFNFYFRFRCGTKKKQMIQR